MPRGIGILPMFWVHLFSRDGIFLIVGVVVGQHPSVISRAGVILG
jgi:hypothetical protein